jgi:tetratricopeptide (TPR) repeat protein
LHEAAGSGHADIAALLLAHGADVNSRIYNAVVPGIPIHSASTHGADGNSMVDSMIHNSLVSSAAGFRPLSAGCTPLHLAASQGHNEVAELLLAHGADVNAKCTDGSTPLDLASAWPRHEQVMELLQAFLAGNTPGPHYYFQAGYKKGGRDLDGAIADFTKAIELKPDYAEAYYFRGLAKQAKRDLDGATTDFTKAIELKPGYAEAKARLQAIAAPDRPKR